MTHLIGSGGMGQVWSAHDLFIDRRVAVKIVLGQDRPDSVEMFLREARTAGAVAHPGVVTVHDVGQDVDGTLFLVMEHLHGRDLAAILKIDGLCRVDQSLVWAAEICDALGAAHDVGLIHRDIKPANLFRTNDGRIKILDFGIARYTEAVSASASRIIGTIAYMPPERINGRVGDHRADLYSLGCVVYELLTGEPPFGSGEFAPLALAHLTHEPTPVSAYRHIPHELDFLLLDLLAKDPDHRPPDAATTRRRFADVAVTIAAQHQVQAGPRAANRAEQENENAERAQHERPTTGPAVAPPRRWEAVAARARAAEDAKKRPPTNWPVWAFLTNVFLILATLHGHAGNLVGAGFMLCLGFAAYWATMSRVSRCFDEHRSRIVMLSCPAPAVAGSIALAVIWSA
ncbi:serine/threonine-protein kinase [Embleya sp. NPDC055664]